MAGGAAMARVCRHGMVLAVLASALPAAGAASNAPPTAVPAGWSAPPAEVVLLARRGHRGHAAEGIGPGAAAAIAREHVGGRVLRVRPRRPGADRYHVKILLPGGRVRTVVVDGRTGEVLE